MLSSIQIGRILQVARSVYPGNSNFNPETDLGLGLSIVRTSIIEDMRGRFWIKSDKYGPGTMVQVAIPL